MPNLIFVLFSLNTSLSIKQLPLLEEFRLPNYLFLCNTRGGTQGLCTCQASSLPLSYTPGLFILKQGLVKLPRQVWNLESSCLNLPSQRDYRQCTTLPRYSPLKKKKKSEMPKSTSTAKNMNTAFQGS